MIPYSSGFLARTGGIKVFGVHFRQNGKIYGIIFGRGLDFIFSADYLELMIRSLAPGNWTPNAVNQSLALFMSMNLPLPCFITLLYIVLGLSFP